MLRVALLHLLCLLLLSCAFLGVIGIPLPIEQTPTRSGPLFLPENFAINSGGQAFGNFVKEEWPWITGRTSSFSVDDDFPIGGKFMNGERQAYVSHRYGLQGAPWGYNLPIMTPGVYDCDLHFAETHSPNFDAGRRVFDATVQNQTQESIDVMKELNGAEFTALVRRWRGLKVYGWLEVRFEAREGDAFLAAITCARTADFVDQADLDKVKAVENQLFAGEIVLGIGPTEMNQNPPESDPTPVAFPDDPCGFFPDPPPTGAPVVPPSVSPSILPDTPVSPPILPDAPVSPPILPDASASPSIIPDEAVPNNIQLLPDPPEPDEPQFTDEGMLAESPELTEEAFPTELLEFTEEPMETEEPEVHEGTESLPREDPQPEPAAEEFLQPFELHVSNLASFTETLKEELKERSAQSTGTLPSKWAMTRIERTESSGVFLVDMVVALNNDDGQQQYEAYIQFIQDGHMNETLQTSFPEANVTLLTLPEFARSDAETPRSDSQSPGVNVGAIVGGVVGGLLVVLAFAIMLLGPGLKRRLEGRTGEDYDSPPPASVTTSGAQLRSRSFAKRNTSGIHSTENFEDDSTFTATTSQIEPIDLLHTDTERDFWGRGTNH